MDNPAYPGSEPAPLPLPRRAAPAPVLSANPNLESRWQVEIDLAGLREREANLRLYEARLRTWQEQLDATGVRGVALRSASPFGGMSGSPFGGDEELRSAWEKLHRARALLEAEQNQVRDDRMVLRDLRADLERREGELAARETALAQRQIEVPVPSPISAGEPKSSSGVFRLAQAPLLAARAVFKTGK